MIDRDDILVDIDSRHTSLEIDDTNSDEVVVQEQDIEIEIEEQAPVTELSLRTPQYEADLERVVPAGVIETGDHAQLEHLDYEHSGHTGFASTADVNAKYTKPASGIPITDLSIRGQQAIALAETAVQPNQLPTWVARDNNVTNFGIVVQVLNDNQAPQMTTLSIR